MTEKIMARVDVESIAALLERVTSTANKTCEAQSGLRTERITLEITHNESFGVSHWSWVTILRIKSGESVRVVEDDRILAASKKLIEVDQEAALRGFDTTTFQRLWISAIARVLGLELARPPRSKCDNPGDGSIPSPGILASPALVEAHQQIAALTAERDAAIREREKAVAFWQGELRARTAERDAARARVAELEAASGDRSTPPEVVLPDNPYHPSGLREGFEHAIRVVRNELVNAGVAVKEVW